MNDINSIHAIDLLVLLLSYSTSYSLDSTKGITNSTFARDSLLDADGCQEVSRGRIPWRRRGKLKVPARIMFWREASNDTHPVRAYSMLVR